MNSAADYLRHIKALILASSSIINIEIVREEALDDLGLYRFRLHLIDKSLLEIFERFSVQRESVQILKYSFHWQNADGQLRKRWDNAAHRPEISTHPHHVHEAGQENALPGKPICAEQILALISEEIDR